MVRAASVQKIERGRVVRVDSTVTDTPVHEPTDSTLLWVRKPLKVATHST
jgi:transposase, IS5 family